MPAQPGPAKGRPECKLVAGIHVFLVSTGREQDVDGRDKPGHDKKECARMRVMDAGRARA